MYYETENKLAEIMESTAALDGTVKIKSEEYRGLIEAKAELIKLVEDSERRATKEREERWSVEKVRDDYKNKLESATKKCDDLMAFLTEKELTDDFMAFRAKKMIEESDTEEEE